jgi:hypothetical protein
MPSDKSLAVARAIFGVTPSGITVAGLPSLTLAPIVTDTGVSPRPFEVAYQIIEKVADAIDAALAAQRAAFSPG